MRDQPGAFPRPVRDCGARDVFRGEARPVQRLGKLRRRREAVGGQLLQRTHDGRGDVGRDRLPLDGDGTRLLGDHARDDRLRGRPRERRLPHQHLVQDAAQGIDVAPGRDLALAHRLFRGHVVRGPERHAGLGHPGAAVGPAHGQRDAEVGDNRAAVVQHDVFGLDVPVHDTVAMRVVEGLRHLGGDADRVLHGELALAREQVADALAFHVGHHVEDLAVRLPRVEEGQDVRMLQVGRGLDFGQEALRADHGGELGPQDLDGDLTVVAEVVRQVHRGHPARAQFAFDGVAVGQGFGEPAHGFAPFRLSSVNQLSTKIRSPVGPVSVSGMTRSMMNERSSRATSYAR